MNVQGQLFKRRKKSRLSGLYLINSKYSLNPTATVQNPKQSIGWPIGGISQQTSGPCALFVFLTEFVLNKCSLKEMSKELCRFLQYQKPKW